MGLLPTRIQRKRIETITFPAPCLYYFLPTRIQRKRIETVFIWFNSLLYFDFQPVSSASGLKLHIRVTEK